MNPESTTATDGVPAGKQKAPRSCCGCLFTSTLGCGAFLIGTGLAGALLGPPLVGPQIVKAMVSNYSDTIEGEIRVSGAEIRWNSRQELYGVRVLDPSSREVMVFNARIPSIGDLLDRR